MITVCKAGNLLRTVGLYDWGSVPGLLGSSDHEHIAAVQYAVAMAQSSWSAFRLEGHDRETHFLREVQFGEGLVFSLVYGEYFVPQRVEGADHGDTETPQADYHQLPDHRPPTWIAGRRSGFGSASRGIAFTEEDVADQVHDGVALCPAEVAVRRLPRCVAQV